MNIESRFLTMTLAAGALALSAGSLAAATVTIDTWQTTTDNPVVDTAPKVVVDDTSNANSLTFSISTPHANGELSGIWLDFTQGFTFALNNVSFLTAGVSIVDFESPADDDIGNGRNLGGNFTPDTQPAGGFDLAFGFDDGDNGGNARRIVLPFAFALSDLGGTLGLENLERVGLRFQSVGTLGQDGLGGDSEKLIGTPPVSAVPLPAGGMLLLAALGALGLRRKRSVH